MTYEPRGLDRKNSEIFVIDTCFRTDKEMRDVLCTIACLALQCGGLGRLLRVVSTTKDPHVAHEARTVLGLMGYSGPVGGKGARLLTIDGGGVR